MSRLKDLYSGENHIDFPALWKRFLVLSAVLVLISVGSLVTRGLNLGIDFEGGSSWEFQADVSVADTRDALRDVGEADARIQTIGTDGVLVRSDTDDPDTVREVRDALAAFADVPPDDISVSTVGPTWGDEITDKAIRALVIFFIVIAAYITIRLEWKMAVGALVAVVHDIVISVGVYSVFQFEVTPATVIAFLTIMGYSLYDTIVVYDKVRETTNRVGSTGRYTYTEMMNLAMNQVIMRSLNTTITSVLPVLSMLVVGSFLLGAVTLQEFAIALLVGLIVGAYSSIFVAAALLNWLKEREPANVEVRRKLEARGETGGATRQVDRADVMMGAGAQRTRAAVSKAPTSARSGTAKAGTGKAGTAKAGGGAEAGAGKAGESAAGGSGASGSKRPAPSGAIPPRPRKQRRKK